MKKALYIFLASSVLLFNCVQAQVVYDDNNVESPYYTQGQKLLKNSQYSSAIIEFKKALRENPNDYSSIISLSNAYNARAAYYNNIIKDYGKAANDLRSAIFFTKYFNTENTNTISDSISAMENNLSTILSATDYSSTPENISKTAKKLRAQGEFAASGYEWYKLLNNAQYKLSANIELGDIMNIFGKTKSSMNFYEEAQKINPNNADLHIKLARAYEQLGNSDKAAKEYNLALASSSETDDILSSLERIWQQKIMQNQNDAEAHANLGVIYQKQKNYDNAMSEYKKAEALNPANINTRLNIGTLYQERKEYEAAIAAYNSILELEPNNVNVLIYKAQSLNALKRYDEAIKTYQIVLTIEPTNKIAKSNLYDVLKNTMPTENVLEYLYQNVKAQPMDANSYYDFAYELHKSDKINDAIIYYKRTLELTNNIPDCYINLSQAYRQIKNYELAKNIIQEGIKKYPENKLMKEQLNKVNEELSNSLYELATKAYEAADYEKAIELYNKITPKNEESLVALASCYQSINKPQLAIDTFKKAMLLSPNNADLPYYIASIYYNKNDFSNAKTYLVNTIKLNPNNKDAKKMLDYINITNSNEKLEKAFNLYSSGKNNEALLILNEVIQNTTNNATAHYYRGLTFDALGKYNMAIADYQSVIKSAPEMSIANYSIAVDYDNIGNYKQAKEYYTKFVASTKESNEYTDYAKKRISEIK